MPPITVQSGLFRREVLPPAKSPQEQKIVLKTASGFEVQISNKNIKTLERACDVTQARVDYLWEAYNEDSTFSFVTKESLFVIWQLNVAHIEFPIEWRAGIVQSLIATDFPRLAIEAYMKHINDIEISTIKVDSSYRWVENFFAVLINYSESSEQFQNAVAAGGAIELMIGLLSNSDDVMEEAKANKHKQHMLDYTLMLMYNLARGLRMRAHFEACGAAKVLEAYFKYNDSDYSRVVAAMCGARIDAGWPEACQLWSLPETRENSNEKCILELLFDYISLASSNEKRRYRGISVHEFAECFRLLALSDNDKELLIRLGILRQVGTMLNSTIEAEHNESINLLFTLCSGKTGSNSASCLAVFDSEEDCMQPLQWLADFADSADLKKYSKRFLDFVNGEVAKESGREKAKKVSRNNSLLNKMMPVQKKITIYLTFHAEDITTVKRVERLLIGMDFKVVNSILSTARKSTESALLNSSFVAVCYSEHYYSSNECRLEIEHAISLKKKIIAFRIDQEKKPEGWLADVISLSQLHVDTNDETQMGSGNQELKQLASLPNNDE